MMQNKTISIDQVSRNQSLGIQECGRGLGRPALVILREYTKHLRCRMLIILCLIMTQFSLRPILAQESILILSSDRSINKYSVVHKAFKEAIDRPTIEVDLGKKSVAERQVKEVIIKENPDIIYCIGSKAYFLAKKFAKDKHLILTSAINWQRFKLNKKTYGIANELPAETELTLFRYFFPELRRIGVLYSKKYNKEWLKGAVADGNNVGIKVIGQAVFRSKDVARALKKLLPKVDAVWLTSDPIVLAEKQSVDKIFTTCDAMKKPIFAYNSAYASYGAVMMISADVPTIGRQAASLVEDVLGHTPIDQKFQSPAGSSIILNMKKVEYYGIRLNKDALDSVNEIIQ